MSHCSVRMTTLQHPQTQAAQTKRSETSELDKVVVVSSSADVMIKIRSYVLAGMLPQCRYFAFEETFGRNVNSKPEHEGVRVADFMDKDVVTLEIDRISRRFQVNRVIAVDEFSACVAAALREKAQCAGASSADARRVRDKLLMKEVVAEAGVSTPRQYTAADLERGDISFPVVVKPRLLAGSVGVRIVRSLQDQSLPELTNAISASEYADMSDKQLHVEEFVDGSLFHLDGLVREQNIIFLLHQDILVLHSNFSAENRLHQRC